MEVAAITEKLIVITGDEIKMKNMAITMAMAATIIIAGLLRS